MTDSHVDSAANSIRLRYVGKVGPDETKGVVQQLEQSLASLRAGFRVLVDLTDLEAMDMACLPHLNRMMDLCNSNGVALVVRVIPDPQKDIGLNIMSLFHYHRGVKIVTCETLEQAEAVFAGRGK